MEKIKLKMKNEFINVNISKKQIKNVHLKVSRDCSVALSTPIIVPDEWITSFLASKKDWIERQIYKYKESIGQDNFECLKNGSSIQILGKDYRIYISKGQNHLEKDEKNLYLYCKKPNNQVLLRKVFNKWWRFESLGFYKKIAEKFYDSSIRKYGVKFPEIVLRKMKTMWGSCNTKKGRITINEYLFKAHPLEISYVIFHELSHLIYPNHNKDFYKFLTINMPDWIERKKILDKEVAQGI